MNYFNNFITIVTSLTIQALWLKAISALLFRHSDPAQYEHNLNYKNSDKWKVWNWKTLPLKPFWASSIETVLYILNRILVLCPPNAGQNIILHIFFQDFDANMKKMRQRRA